MSTNWDHNRLTLEEVRKRFLDATTQEIKQRIKDGTYILKDLNEK